MTAVNQYFDNLLHLLSELPVTQGVAMERAAQAMAGCLRRDGVIYTFGTGHGHLLALEIFYRAGGPAQVCPILDERLMLHLSAAGSTQWEREAKLVDVLLTRYPIAAGDVLVAISNSGRNAVPVRLAQRAKERGATVIALTSLRHSSAVTVREGASAHLYEVADIVLDNGGILGDALVEMADGSLVGPTSTAAGAALLQAVVSRVKELSLLEGWTADFFSSSNVDGGDAANERLIEKYRRRIPGLA